jgi:sugar phosphate isomerase/epimerase
MAITRRQLGKLALAGVPAAALASRYGSLIEVLAQARPNSLIAGVQIGVITYSYRSMADQSAEATLKYVVDSGISAIELMGGPVEGFAGAPAIAGGGRGAAGGGRAAGAAPPPAPAPVSAPVTPAPPGTWNGQPCPAPAGRGGGGGGRGRGDMTPEQQAAVQEQAAKLKAWRTSVSMDAFKKLRKMYNDAGVTIYAWKQLSANMSDEEFEYIFNVAEALGCTHTTLELPTDPAQLKRIGDFAMKKKIYAAYHTHLQGTMTAFDQAFAASPGNMANVDFGHFVAGGNVGGTPMQFLEKFHDRIASFHIKDRTTPEHCALNLAWGTGETPIKQLLEIVSKNSWKIPATIELEYDIPEGSDAVREVKKCVDYCRAALGASSSPGAAR